MSTMNLASPSNHSMSTPTPASAAALTRRVTLNCSGTISLVTLGLLQKHPQTLLAQLTAPLVAQSTSASSTSPPLSSEVFLERDPASFNVILNWYRYGKLIVPRDVPYELVADDIIHFRLPIVVDANRLLADAASVGPSFNIEHSPMNGSGMFGIRKAESMSEESGISSIPSSQESLPSLAPPLNSLPSFNIAGTVVPQGGIYNAGTSFGTIYNPSSGFAGSGGIVSSAHAISSYMAMNEGDAPNGEVNSVNILSSTQDDQPNNQPSLSPGASQMNGNNSSSSSQHDSSSLSASTSSSASSSLSSPPLFVHHNSNSMFNPPPIAQSASVEAASQSDLPQNYLHLGSNDVEGAPNGAAASKQVAVGPSSVKPTVTRQGTRGYSAALTQALAATAADVSMMPPDSQQPHSPPYTIAPASASAASSSSAKAVHSEQQYASMYASPSSMQGMHHPTASASATPAASSAAVASSSSSSSAHPSANMYAVPSFPSSASSSSSSSSFKQPAPLPPILFTPPPRVPFDLAIEYLTCFRDINRSQALLLLNNDGSGALSPDVMPSAASSSSSSSASSNSQLQSAPNQPEGTYLFRYCNDTNERDSYGNINKELFVLSYMRDKKMLNTKIFRIFIGEKNSLGALTTKGYVLSELKEPQKKEQTFNSIIGITHGVIGVHARALQ